MIRFAVDFIYPTGTLVKTIRDKFFHYSIRGEGKEIEHLATWWEHYMVFVACLAFIDFYFLTSLCTQFEANENINGKNVSLNGTSAHYLRIHPVSFNGVSACMRIALYGCNSGKFWFYLSLRLLNLSFWNMASCVLEAVGVSI